jgi:hypothetical protein
VHRERDLAEVVAGAAPPARRGSPCVTDNIPLRNDDRSGRRRRLRTRRRRLRDVLRSMFCASLASVSPGSVASRPMREQLVLLSPRQRAGSYGVAHECARRLAFLSHLRRGYRQPRGPRGVQSVRLRRLRERGSGRRGRCFERRDACCSAGVRTNRRRAVGSAGRLLHEDELPVDGYGARCARRRGSSSSCSTFLGHWLEPYDGPHRAVPRLDGTRRAATRARRTISSRCAGSSRTSCRRRRARVHALPGRATACRGVQHT